MKKGIKIVTIGGGSSYTPELVEGFIKRHAHLPVRELWLVDIEAGREKLEIVGNLAQRMVEKAGLEMEVHLTTNREEALKDADFVTTQLRVGLLEARIKDERIPLSHKVIGQETNGAGGLFKALRTVPVILDIISDIERLCPNAWLINFTNPTGIISEAVFNYTNFKRYIGLCNVPIGMQSGIAQMFKVEKHQVDIDFAGLNHLVYGLNIRIDGIDVTKEALAKLAEESMTMQNIKNIPLNADFVKALGVMTCPYHKYYYKTKEMLEEELEKFKTGETRAEVVKRLEDELFELYRDPNLNIKPPQLEKRGGAYYSDAACNLIDSIYNDKKDIQVVNTVNNGTIKTIQDNSTVEVSCVITKDGPKPINVGYLPPQISGLVSQIKSFEMLAAKAAVEADYNSALNALCVNPLIPSDDLAKIILDEMLEAHKAYLPQFNKGE